MIRSVQISSDEAKFAATDRKIVERPAQPVLRRFHSRRIWWVFGALALVVASVVGLQVYAHLKSFESTDDAFITVHYTLISSKVAGRVAKVNVGDDQVVKKGDILVELDPRDFNAALEQKKAALKSSVAQVKAARAAFKQAIASLKSAQATVDEDTASAEAARATYENAHVTYGRDRRLFAQRVIAPQDLDNAAAGYRSSKAYLLSDEMKVRADKAKVGEAQAQVAAVQAYVESEQAKVGQSQADVDVARLNDSYTIIRAPEDGRITDKSVALGDYVQVGQSLCALVPKNVWVVANFKETQLAHMHPGQLAKIEIDALHRSFPGQVKSIQAGSGAEFSLLPPENATGNYVKVVQRVPVKIVFDHVPDVSLPLGPGESVTPSVEVRQFHYPPVVLATIGVIVLLAAGWMLRNGFHQDWIVRGTT
jgi:membrane fusion protein, multidrug efflux system